MQKRAKKATRRGKKTQTAQYIRFPKTLQELGPAYKALVRELAKR